MRLIFHLLFKTFQLDLFSPAIVEGFLFERRVYMSNGRTRYTPLRPSTGQPVSAGVQGT